MEIIWPAIVIYSIGLGLVLYLRPALMFNENGTWKEFGYNRGSRHTIFPFWLFSVVWALVAYALASFLVASVFTGVFTGAAVAAMPSMPSYQSPSESEGDSAFETDTDVEEVIAPPPQQVSKKPRAGYYVLNADTRKNGIRKYVYYGSEPPK
jgi:hypothetical protein